MHMQAAAVLLHGRGGARGLLQLLMSVRLSRLLQGPVRVWCSLRNGADCASSHRRSTYGVLTAGRVCVALLHPPASCYWGWLGWGLMQHRTRCSLQGGLTHALVTAAVCESRISVGDCARAAHACCAGRVCGGGWCAWRWLAVGVSLVVGANAWTKGAGRDGRTLVTRYGACLALRRTTAGDVVRTCKHVLPVKESTCGVLYLQLLIHSHCC